MYGCFFLKHGVHSMQKPRRVGHEALCR